MRIRGNSLFLVFAILTVQLPGWAYARANKIVGCNKQQYAAITRTSNALDSVLSDLVFGSDRIESLDYEFVYLNFIAPGKRQPRSPSHDFAAARLSYERYIARTARTLRRVFEGATLGYEVRCERITSPICLKDSIRFGYVLIGLLNEDHSIHLCQPFFDSVREIQLTIMLHELSHLAADTEDFQKTEVKTPLALWYFPQDAYHIERFANQSARYVVQSEVWQLLWKRPPASER